MSYLVKVFTYHRFVSSTQTSEDIQKQIKSLEIWGKAAHNVYQSNIPKVKAFVGYLPKSRRISSIRRSAWATVGSPDHVEPRKKL